MKKHSGVDDGTRGWEGRSKGAERVPLRPTQSPAVLPQLPFRTRQRGHGPDPHVGKHRLVGQKTHVRESALVRIFQETCCNIYQTPATVQPNTTFREVSKVVNAVRKTA